LESPVRFRVFDIETVPDDSVWTRGEPKWRWEARSHARDMSVMTRFHPDETVLVREDPFPPPHACRVVAISWVDVELDAEHSPRYRFDSMGSECRWSLAGAPDAERELLRSFGESTQALADEGGLCLVTWNGRGFDLPVVNLRSLMHGLPCKWYYENRDVRYRYSTEGHLDLMDFLGDYGAARNMKLGDVARLVGLPGKTGEVTGASVHDVYRRTLARASEAEFCSREMAEVGRYCLRDSLQTAIIFLRSRHHLGKIDGGEYNRCLGTFAGNELVREAIDVDWGAVRLVTEGETRCQL
jgi:predicted PolB exonuclease-like 3'-5' exonuclease